MSRSSGRFFCGKCLKISKKVTRTATKAYALFNVNSAPPANAGNGYIMFDTTTHKTLVRYNNKWWDAMGNEVTE